MNTINQIALTTTLHTTDTSARDDEFQVIITVDQLSPFYRRSAVCLMASLLYMGIGQGGGTNLITVEHDSHQLIVSTTDPRKKHLAAEIVRGAIANFRALGAK